VCLSLFAFGKLEKLSIVKSQTFKGYLMHVVGSKLQSYKDLMLLSLHLIR